MSGDLINRSLGILVISLWQQGYLWVSEPRQFYRSAVHTSPSFRY